MGSTHTLLTPTIIAKEALMKLRNNLVMGDKVHRNYEMEFPGGPKKGGSVTIRKPNKFKVTTGRTRATSTITENSITLTVSEQKHVSWAFNSKDLTLTIEEYSDRYIEPAAIALANEIDATLCDLYKDVWNDVYESTGFVTPESFIVMGKAGQRLDEEAVPRDQRCIVLNPAANWSLANAMKNMYVTDVSKPALKKGFLAMIGGFEIYMDQNIKVHTTGAFHSTGSTAALLVGTTGGNTGTLVEIIHARNVSTIALKKGDVFTIADVYAVNPISGESTGTLRQFVVTADASAAATETSVIISAFVQPDLIDTGAYKTVDTLPAAAAAVTVLGTQGEPYPENLAFHKNAFALVMVPLVKPEGAWGSTATEAGFSIRLVKDYDINTDDEICRMDVLYGVKTLYPELACRIRGAEG
jgi:hypothetical protein